MKKQYILILSITLLVLLSSFASAAPAWKKQQTTPTAPSTPTKTTTTTQPTVTEKVIIINNTQAPAPVIQETPWYKDWNFIGVAIVIIGGLVGWLISRRVRGKTAKYMSDIDDIYRKYNKNSNKCEAKLVGLREQIEEDFKKGKINDQSLSLLDSRIEKYSKELRGEALQRRAMPEDLRKKIKSMLSDGVITKDEYSHFNEMLKKTRMESKDKEEIDKLMKRWKDEDKK